MSSTVLDLMVRDLQREVHHLKEIVRILLAHCEDMEMEGDEPLDVLLEALVMKIAEEEGLLE